MWGSYEKTRFSQDSRAIIGDLCFDTYGKYHRNKETTVGQTDLTDPCWSGGICGGGAGAAGSEGNRRGDFKCAGEDWCDFQHAAFYGHCHDRDRIYLYPKSD